MKTSIKYQRVILYSVTIFFLSFSFNIYYSQEIAYAGASQDFLNKLDKMDPETLKNMFADTSTHTTNKYWIKYDANGGSGEITGDMITVETSSPKYTLKDNQFKPPNPFLKFSGWKNNDRLYSAGDSIEDFNSLAKIDGNSDGVGTRYVTNHHDIIFQANWVPNYPIIVAFALGSILIVSTIVGLYLFFNKKNTTEIESVKNNDVSSTNNSIAPNDNNNTTQPTNTTTSSTADEIRKFKELLDDGAITEEEYEKKKQELLE